MFSKTPQSAARPSGRNARAGANFSVLGADIVIGGDLNGATELHVDGTVKGDIKCASLIQGEASEVTGTVVADNARVAGTIKGSITASTLVILKTATIEGDVTYGALTIESGARVDGRFTHDVAEPKLVLAGGTEVGLIW
jgi:cytoskeletal protein CcmA (bactofilin family)